MRGIARRQRLFHFTLFRPNVALLCPAQMLHCHQLAATSGASSASATAATNGGDADEAQPQSPPSQQHQPHAPHHTASSQRGGAGGSHASTPASNGAGSPIAVTPRAWWWYAYKCVQLENRKRAGRFQHNWSSIAFLFKVGRSVGRTAFDGISFHTSIARASHARARARIEERPLTRSAVRSKRVTRHHHHNPRERLSAHLPRARRARPPSSSPSTARSVGSYCRTSRRVILGLASRSRRRRSPWRPTPLPPPRKRRRRPACLGGTSGRARAATRRARRRARRRRRRRARTRASVTSRRSKICGRTSRRPPTSSSLTGERPATPTSRRRRRRPRRRGVAAARAAARAGPRRRGGTASISTSPRRERTPKPNAPHFCGRKTARRSADDRPAVAVVAVVAIRETEGCTQWPVARPSSQTKQHQQANYRRARDNEFLTNANFCLCRGWDARGIWVARTFPRPPSSPSGTHPPLLIYSRATTVDAPILFGDAGSAVG